MIRLFFLCCLVFCVASCSVKDEKLFSLLTSTGIDFSNNIHNTKDFNIFTYRNYYNGGGVAIGDVNNDGLADVFFTANMGANKLYLNKGNFQFEDVSQKAGIENKGHWNTGVVMVDINNDNWLDLYVCNAGYVNGNIPVSRMYINNKNGTFTDAAKQYGLENRGGYATHAAFFDYDIDGDLDCFLINNSFIPVNTLNYANERKRRAKDWPVADFLKGGGDRFLRNDDGVFSDVSEQAGIHGSLISFGLGVTVGDVNGDGYPDVYVSNDFFERDYLYVNQRNGTFKDELETRVQHTSLASMGADMGDINNDGKVDIFTTDMLPSDDYRLKTTTTFDNVDVERLKVASGFYYQYMQNTLQVNRGDGTFADAAFHTGVAASDWSWGGLMFDADGNGYSDLFVCNGIYNDVTDQDFIEYFANDVIQKMVMTGKKEEIDNVIKKMPSQPIPNKMFRNGGDLRFADAAPDWGLDQPSFSNGAAYGDLDNDGDLDLVVNNVNARAFVYRNNQQERVRQAYIGFQLQGTERNRFAVGSLVKVFCGREILSRDLMPARGFQSSVDYKLLFGLGNRRVDSVQILWPDRTVTTLLAPAVNTLHRIKQQQATRRPYTGEPDALQPLLQAQPVPFAKHVENEHTDFYNERGVPMLLSREGPKAATGDVNADGLDDLFICGAAAQGGQLYLQQGGGYTAVKTVLNDAVAFEQTAAVFFDADGDKDLDLVVGTGGNEKPAGSFAYQTLLFLNDGKGRFAAGAALPSGGLNTSVIVAEDIEGDGDADLFIGSRSVPLQYGVVPQSQVLLNDGAGKFTDATEKFLPDKGRIGFITDARWVNVAGNEKKELVVVGEWLAPLVLSFETAPAKILRTRMENYTGWWQSLASADLDGDGDNDLVAGNWGQNAYLMPAAGAPVKMWVADFDNNGTAEKIFTRTVNGKDVPVFMKKDLTDQIASLKKQNLNHTAFAKRSIQELFPAEVLKKAQTFTWLYSASAVLRNNGGGSFTVEPLPTEAQLSSVNALAITDLNNDRKPDLLLAGNTFGLQPQFSRLDAGQGLVLLNNGSAFTAVPPAQAGLQVRGAVRAIVPLKARSATSYLFLQNNDTPRLYRVALPPVGPTKKS